MNRKNTKMFCHIFHNNPYLYLYLWGGRPKPSSVEAMYVWPNAQP